MVARVVVTRELLPGPLDRLVDMGCDVVQLPSDHEPTTAELRDAVRGADALICLLRDQVDASVLDAGLPTLRIVANVAVGVDNVDLVAAAARGIAVANTPGVLDAATADLAMALLLAVRRRLLDGVELLRSGRWAGFSLGEALGTDLAGTTLGLVGYGRIGQKVGARAAAFEMEVLHTTRRPTGLPGYVADLDELLGRSDSVSLHVPLTEGTRHLLDAARLGSMRRGAVLVNTARGPVVDEDALVDALQSGHLGGAGLDVYSSEPDLNPRLLGCPNVVLTPHIGSATVGTRTRMCELAVEAVVEVLAGRTPANLVTGAAPDRTG